MPPALERAVSLTSVRSVPASAKTSRSWVPVPSRFRNSKSLSYSSTDPT